MIHSYPAFDLWRTSSTQSGFFHSRHEQSLCFVVLRKGVLKHHTQALEMSASAFPITARCGETPSFMEASAVPIMWVQTYTMHTHERACTHTHTHTHSSSTIQLRPACHQRGRPRWQIDAAAGVFSFFSFSLPPPTEPFFPSLGIKWSNDVPLQNSISQFS